MTEKPFNICPFRRSECVSPCSFLAYPPLHPTGFIRVPADNMITEVNDFMMEDMGEFRGAVRSANLGSGC